MSAVATISLAPDVRLGRILYATDFSPESFTALPLVASLAQRYRSAVQVLHVIPPTPITVIPEGAAYVFPSTSDAEEKMKQVMHADVFDGVQLEPTVRMGVAAEAIMDEARDRKADLIVLGTRGLGGLKHFFVGSVCEELARSAPCPLLTVGPHIDKRFSHPERAMRILIPVDFTSESMHVMPYAMSIAAEFGSTITFLHVRTHQDDKIPRARSSYLVSKMRRIFQRHVPVGCATNYVVESGDIPSAVLAVAYETWADLIAMGVRKKQDVGFQIRGSNTYKVIAGAQCPVLTSHSQ